MEFEKITESILKEAKEKAEDIIKEAEREISLKREKLNSEIEKRKKEIEEEGERIKEEEKKRLTSLYNLEKRMEFVKYKNEKAEEIFSELENRIRKLSKEEYLKWMEKLLNEITFTGNEIVILDKDDKYLEDFLKEYADKKKIHVDISSSREDLGGGGFIVKRGNVEFNSSFNVLIKEMRENFFAYIGEELFGEA